MNKLPAILGTSMLVSVAGCAVGPDYEPPAAPSVSSYVTTNDVQAQSAPSLVLHDVAREWWHAFGSAEVDDAVARALAANPTLTSARAALAQARDIVNATRGGYFPQADASAVAMRAKQRNTGVYNLFSIGPIVSYDIDLFGGTRRRVEQSTALADLQRAQLGAAYLSLTGNTVSQAIAIAGTRELINATQEIIAADKRTLTLVQVSTASGHSAQLDVLAAESELANDRGLLPPLLQQLEAAQHAFTVLTGQLPSQWAPPALAFTQLTVPRELPLVVPSELVRLRPDIVAADAQLHAASAAIGIATADLYPKLSLSASYTYEATQTAGLFASNNSYWSGASGLTAPLFHGGTLRAERQAAIDAYDARAADYRATVLEAFRQVADVMRALVHDTESVEANTKAQMAARASLDLTQQSYQAGQSSLLQLLDAERRYQLALVSLVRAQTQQLNDSAQWFVAMGGAWNPSSSQ